MICQFCNIEHAIAVPVIHLNGTSADELLSGLESAVLAVQETIQCLHVAAPNNRDYFPLNLEARVQDEHTIRARNLCEVRKQLTEMRDHVQAVVDFRLEQRRRRV